MAIDITRFKIAFFEESREGLDTMETVLLELGRGATEPDPEMINTIFRAAHSIKGGCGTFGYQEIGGFTHGVETLLDLVRGGSHPLDGDTVDLLLECTDAIRAMFAASEGGDPVQPERLARLSAALEASAHAGCGASAEAAPAFAGPSSAAVAEPDTPRWRIHFRPQPELLRYGNDPIRIFRELDGLGALEVVADTSLVPPIEELDPSECHLSWTLRLEGGSSAKEVERSFDWVLDECDLKIVPDEDEVPAEAEIEPAVESLVSSAEESMAGSRSPSSAAEEPGATPAKAASGGGSEGKARSIRVDIEKIDALVNMVGELVITQSMLGQLGREFHPGRLDELKAGLAQLELNTRELQERVMRVRMVPVSHALQRLPRIVHDLCTRLGKQAELVLAGESAELDKTVAEQIQDPLVHIVRNSLDHGLETPEEREALGKPRKGVVEVSSYQEGESIVIEIRDDGRGLCRDRIRQKAEARGLLVPGQVITDGELLDLVFHPGFSTAETISDVSGRGVGMDVVRRNVRALGGQVMLRSVEGEGTTVAIRLPLTLAIIDGQLLRVGGEQFVVPVASVVESIQVDANSLENLPRAGQVYRLRNDYVPVCNLSALLGVKSQRRAGDRDLLVIVEAEGVVAGLAVDDLLGQQQIVVKSLETNYRHVEGVSGATILGDGKVALILDIKGLIQLARTHTATAPGIAKAWGAA